MPTLYGITSEPIFELPKKTYRDYRNKRWMIGFGANAMRWLELLVSGLFAWEVTHSALAVTVVVALRQIPQLLFGAFAGAISEALNRKLIVMASLLGPAIVSTALAALAVPVPGRRRLGRRRTSGRSWL